MKKQQLVAFNIVIALAILFATAKAFNTVNIYKDSECSEIVSTSVSIATCMSYAYEANTYAKMMCAGDKIFLRKYTNDTCQAIYTSTTSPDEEIIPGECTQIGPDQYVKGSCSAPKGLKKGLGLVRVGFASSYCDAETATIADYTYTACESNGRGKFITTTCDKATVYDTVCDDSKCTRNCNSTVNRYSTRELNKCDFPGSTYMCTGYEPLIGDIDTKQFVAQ